MGKLVWKQGFRCPLKILKTSESKWNCQHHLQQSFSGQVNGENCPAWLCYFMPRGRILQKTDLLDPSVIAERFIWWWPNELALLHCERMRIHPLSTLWDDRRGDNQRENTKFWITHVFWIRFRQEMFFSCNKNVYQNSSLIKGNDTVMLERSPSFSNIMKHRMTELYGAGLRTLCFGFWAMDKPENCAARYNTARKSATNSKELIHALSHEIEREQHLLWLVLRINCKMMYLKHLTIC